MRLDTYLYENGFINSRNRGANLIKSGKVLVNSRACMKPSTEVGENDHIKITDTTHYVSRAAQKLLTIYEHPKLSILMPTQDKICLDIGASTGGFTQVLLEYGARQVFALDVGHSQLNYVLKNDSRVVQVEGVNIRDVLTLTDLADAPKDGFDIVVCDISFISVTFALPPILAVLKPGGVAAILIKPQFELGKSEVKKASGVIKSQRLQDIAKDMVINKAYALGFKIHDVLPAKLTGTSGNQEFIALLTL